MTMYAIYTPAHQELATERAITDLGIRAECAKQVDLIRQGKRRWPDPVVSSHLPNYVFGWLGPEDWHRVVKVKTVRDLMGIGPKWGVRAEKWVADVNATFTAKMAEIERWQRLCEENDQRSLATRRARDEARQRISEYTIGDTLEIVAGPLAGQLAQFRAMVEDAAGLFPQIEADMQIMGQTVKTKLDPLTARKIG